MQGCLWSLKLLHYLYWLPVAIEKVLVYKLYCLRVLVTELLSFTTRHTPLEMIFKVSFLSSLLVESSSAHNSLPKGELPAMPRS